jgi:adenylosuccinate synthase
LSTLAVIGTQWGDEGKGKITDYLAQDADMVVRYQGGANAGHTIEIGNEVFALHLLPSGILTPGILSVIGNGVVVDLEALEEEMAKVEASGRSMEGLRISDRANVVMRYHRLLDGAEERQLGDRGVGTTGRGIGPCYSDKIARYGIRVCDLLEEGALRERLEVIYPMKKRQLEILGGEGMPAKDELLRKLLSQGKRLERHICDASVLVNDAIKKGKKVLFEGAQGTMLDIDHGTYPFVTSSNCISGGICTGVGIGPSMINEIVGVMKAYTTRVGSGPFPTELTDDMGKMLLTKGGEFGATTGRARRCGWLDLVIVRHSVRLNGLSNLAVTKLDVLGGIDKIKICTSYEIDGKVEENFPASLSRLQKARPVYHELKGWEDFTAGKAAEFASKGYDSLPSNLRAYLDFVSKNVGTPIRIVSLGKERSETIDLRSHKKQTIHSFY